MRALMKNIVSPNSGQLYIVSRGQTAFFRFTLGGPKEKPKKAVWPCKTSIYVIVVTWARGISLICMPKARGLRVYISARVHNYIMSGKSREHMLQVICITSDCGF